MLAAATSQLKPVVCNHHARDHPRHPPPPHCCQGRKPRFLLVYRSGCAVTPGDVHALTAVVAAEYAALREVGVALQGRLPMLQRQDPALCAQPGLSGGQANNCLCCIGTQHAAAQELLHCAGIASTLLRCRHHHCCMAAVATAALPPRSLLHCRHHHCGHACRRPASPWRAATGRPSPLWW